MAGETGQPTADLIAALRDDPAAFDFFQAVRLLLAERGARPEVFPSAVRIRPDLGLDYPESDIAEVNLGENGDCEIVTTFLGLYGVSSPLPAFYSEDLLDDEWEEDRSARGFLDIVHQHLYPLLYRAWLKHRFADNAIGLGREDYWELLYAVAGLKQPEMRAGLGRPGRLLPYLGLLTQQPRSASGLETVIGYAMAPVPVQLVPCVPRWVKVPEAQRLRLGEGAKLGEDAVVGAQVEDRMGRFQLRIGPLAGDAFQELAVDAERMGFLRLLIGFYLVEPLECELVFDITGESVLPARLGGEYWSRLGYDTWLRSDEESPPVAVRMMA